MNYQTLTGLTALIATLLLPNAAFAATSVNSSQSPAPVSRQLIADTGVASYYGGGANEGGSSTASGERFSAGAYTAAHRSLPFGTRVRVTNTRTGRSVVVRINDRGPFVGGRSIDLSTGAARAIGLTETGVGTVRMDVIGGGGGSRRSHGRRHR